MRSFSLIAIALIGAFVYAECAVRIPRSGGFFNYYRAGLGEGPAFVAGWAGYVATYPASMAAIARVFGDVLPAAIPGVPSRPQLYAALALALVGGLNVAGVRLSASVQRILTGGKVAAVAAVLLAAVIAVASKALPDASAPPVSAAPGTFAALSLAALVAVLWAYDGWSDVTLVAGEVKDPGRNIGRTVLVGSAVLVVLYGGVQLAISGVTLVIQRVLVDRLSVRARTPGSAQNHLFRSRIAQVKPDPLEPDGLTGELHGAPQHEVRIGVARELVGRSEHVTKRLVIRR